MAQAYRKKPIVVSAIQWTGDNWPEVSAWYEERVGYARPGTAVWITLRREVKVKTPEGIVDCSPWSWIVHGGHGEFYPVQDAIFRDTFEEV